MMPWIIMNHRRLTDTEYLNGHCRCYSYESSHKPSIPLHAPNTNSQKTQSWYYWRTEPDYYFSVLTRLLTVEGVDPLASQVRRLSPGGLRQFGKLVNPSTTSSSDTIYPKKARYPAAHLFTSPASADDFRLPRELRPPGTAALGWRCHEGLGQRSTALSQGGGSGGRKQCYE